jgi:hypothetical protein
VESTDWTFWSTTPEDLSGDIALDETRGLWQLLIAVNFLRRWDANIQRSSDLFVETDHSLGNREQSHLFGFFFCSYPPINSPPRPASESNLIVL